MTTEGTNQLIHAFSTREGEEIQLNLREYNGRHFMDLRHWYEKSPDEGYFPTKRGIVFPIDQLPELRDALVRLEETHRKKLQPSPAQASRPPQSSHPPRQKTGWYNNRKTPPGNRS